MPFLLDIARESGQLNRFVELVEEAGLVTILNGPGQFTIFAPSDEAFAQAPEDILSQYTKMPFYIKKLIQHHLVIGELSDTDLCTQLSLSNVDGGELNIIDDYGITRISGARLTTANLAAENGILHIIDRALWPVLYKE
jgi:uncharacterized surface protein with fasciclin (FAS1) repeats